MKKRREGQEDYAPFPLTHSKKQLEFRFQQLPSPSPPTAWPPLDLSVPDMSLEGYEWMFEYTLSDILWAKPVVE